MSDTHVKPMKATMEPETWMDINSATTQLSGSTLEELAAANPNAAYIFIRTGLLMLADSAGMAHGEMAKGKTYQEAERTFPEVVQVPTEMQVNLFETMDETGQELPRIRGRASTQVLSFVVEPPTDLFS